MDGVIRIMGCHTTFNICFQNHKFSVKINIDFGIRTDIEFCLGRKFGKFECPSERKIGICRILFRPDPSGIMPILFLQFRNGRNIREIRIVGLLELFLFLLGRRNIGAGIGIDG